MGSVDVVVIAKKETPYCASCGGGRTLEDITHSIGKQLRQRYGGAVNTRFVDVRDLDETDVPPEVLAGNPRLPIVMIGGKVRYRGIFSPTFIRRDVKELLEGAAGKALGNGREHGAQERGARWVGAAERAPGERALGERGVRQWYGYSGGGWATSSVPATGRRK